MFRMGTSVAVAGASGYAGGELLRLLAGHPTSRWSRPPRTATPASRSPRCTRSWSATATLCFTDTSAEVLAGAELVFLALPHGASAGLVPELPDSAKVVDLGADFRLADADAWQRYYGGPHAGTWTYGLPELPGQRAVIAASDRVANTGCYAVGDQHRAGAADRRRPGRGRGRGGGGGLRHVRRRPGGQARPARQRGDG